MPRRSLDVRQRRGAHDRRDRRTQDDRHQQGHAARPHLPQPHDQDLSDHDRLLRHGGHDPARRQLFPARRARARRAQAGALSARPRRRRQILARRAAQGADGDAADLRARGRRRTEPGVRIAARPVPPRRDGRDARTSIQHPAAQADRHLLALGGQAARRTRRRHLQVFGRQALPVAAAPDRRRQDRARRREQPGHLGAGRQGRHPQARDISRSTIPTPTAIRAASTARRRGCSNSSKCSRRRSRCCTRC